LSICTANIDLARFPRSTSVSTQFSGIPKPEWVVGERTSSENSVFLSCAQLRLRCQPLHNVITKPPVHQFPDVSESILRSGHLSKLCSTFSLSPFLSVPRTATETQQHHFSRRSKLKRVRFESDSMFCFMSEEQSFRWTRYGHHALDCSLRGEPLREQFTMSTLDMHSGHVTPKLALGFVS
jgi:hypothetical protein